jgi:hypothetical protein
MECVEPPEKRCAGVDGTVRCGRTLPLEIVQAETAGNAGPVTELVHEREHWIVRLDQDRIYCQAHQNQGITPTTG